MNKMNNYPPLVVGLGEILWDLLPEGKKMGGAPANFIYHISQLGARGYIVSAIGDDENGRELIRELESKNVNTGYVGINKERPTGTVSVNLDSHGNPSYVIHENVAWDFLELTLECRNLIKTADAVCFGSLAQRSEVSKNTIENLLCNTTQNCLRVFDINLRQNYYSHESIIASFKIANVVKINEDELKVISKYENIEGSDTELMETLLKRYELLLIALTRGNKPSILYTSDEISILDTPKVSVADTVGAGDSFTAALVAGLLKGLKISEIHKMATEISAWVCTQPGATPKYDLKLNNYNLFSSQT